MRGVDPLAAKKGLLYPGAFLPTIENLPISIELGEWVIATALNQAAQWCAQGRRLAVSVNISAYQLMHPDFEQRLSGLLGAQTRRRTAADRGAGTSAPEDVEHVATVMQRCRGLGVRFALDDGTGYSSLTYLKRLAVECIKIDQSFVRDMLHDAEDPAIVKGVIDWREPLTARSLPKALKRPSTVRCCWNWVASIRTGLGHCAGHACACLGRDGWRTGRHLRLGGKMQLAHVKNKAM